MIGLKKKKEKGEGMKEIVNPNAKSVGELKFQKEQNELYEISKDIPQARLIKDNNKSIMDFDVEFTPDNSSYWYGGKYRFSVHVPDNYPFEPPKVHCLDKIYHPNIDYDGNVCLNILKDNWEPTLTASKWIAGIYFLFCEPNPNDPLNHEVAKVMRENEAEFKENVKKTLRGGYMFCQNFKRFK